MLTIHQKISSLKILWFYNSLLYLIFSFIFMCFVYGLLCLGRLIKNQCIINKKLRYINYKKFNNHVRNLKVQKENVNIEKSLKYKLIVFYI